MYDINKYADSLYKPFIHKNPNPALAVSDEEICSTGYQLIKILRRIKMDNINKYADSLYQSSINKKPISALTDIDNSLTIDDAYAVQMVNVKRMVGQGEIISGKKIGLTSEGMQKLLGVNEPDYGHLYQSMDFSETGCLRYDDFISPKIEGEVAFRLKEDLSGGRVTVDDVHRATDYVIAAFEIVDSRVADWKIQLIDTVSDNASSGAYVLGSIKAGLNEIDLINLPMKLYKNNSFISEGVGAAVLGDPCTAVAWLSNRLWDYGVTLKAGEIILSGAFSAAPAVSRGDCFEADFGQLGSVRAEFV